MRWPPHLDERLGHRRRGKMAAGIDSIWQGESQSEIWLAGHVCTPNKLKVPTKLKFFFVSCKLSICLSRRAALRNATRPSPIFDAFMPRTGQSHSNLLRSATRILQGQ